MAQKLLFKTNNGPNVTVLSSLCKLKVIKTADDKGVLTLEVPIDNNGLALFDSEAIDDSITFSIKDGTPDEIDLKPNIDFLMKLDPAGNIRISLNGIDTKIGKTG